MRPYRLIPVALVAIALGLAFSAPSVSAITAPTTSGASGFGAQVPSDDTKTAVGSGQKNLYSRVGNGVPDVANPGKYLYTQGCSSCHGANGEGSLQGSLQVPSLIGVGAAAVDFYLSTGRMPLNAPAVQAPRKKPAYTRAQINEIVKYVSSLSAGPPIPQVDLAKGDLVEGNQIYANNCAACHNSAGSGGALGRNYYAPALISATPTQIAEAVRVGPGAMPVFGPNTFSDQQVNSLVRYVTHLQKQDNRGGLSIGRIGPVSEGFVGWVVGLGALLGITRWIGTRV